jgi:hypothetical protein
MESTLHDAVMKQATALSGKTSRKPQASGAMVPSTLGASPQLHARPMVRSTGGLGSQEPLRPRRLRATEAPLPPVSRLIYRAGGVLVR